MRRTNNPKRYRYLILPFCTRLSLQETNIWIKIAGWKYMHTPLHINQESWKYPINCAQHSKRDTKWKRKQRGCISKEHINKDFFKGLKIFIEATHRKKKKKNLWIAPNMAKTRKKKEKQRGGTRVIWGCSPKLKNGPKYRAHKAPTRHQICFDTLYSLSQNNYIREELLTTS